MYIYMLVLEKKTKVREMMKMHGLKLWHYYLVNFIFFFALYAVSFGLFWGSGLAVNLRYESFLSGGFCSLNLVFSTALTGRPSLLSLWRGVWLRSRLPSSSLPLSPTLALQPSQVRPLTFALPN